MVRGADVGSLLTGLKSLLFGGAAAAAKTAAVVAVVGTVAVATPGTHHARSHLPAAPRVSTPAASLPVRKAEPVRSSPAPVFRPAFAVRKETKRHVSRPVVAAAPVVAAEAASPSTAADDSAPQPAATNAHVQESSAPTEGDGKGQGSAGRDESAVSRPQSEDGSNRGSSADQAAGQGKAGPEGKGSSDSAPPPAEESSSGGSGGNGKGNDQTDGAAAAGHGH